MSILAASLAVSVPAGRAAADAGDALAGGIIGGIIGGAIVKESNKPKRQTYTTRHVPSATRAQNAEVQTSLNYFGFAAGSPDGVLGRNSRTAISQYQVFMGYPPSGYLTDYERSFLVSSYHRAITGGAATTQLVAQNQMGTRGLLKAYQQEAAGIPPTMATTPMAPQTPLPQQQGTMAFAPVEEAAPQTPALPNFVAQSGRPSLASHCNKVSLLTNSNGGFTTQAAMTDANFALNEQFCLARTYAIARGEELAQQVQGFSSDQIAQQCAGFGPAMKEHVAALSLKPQAEVLQGVGGFILNSGMSLEQLAGTARICLSVGYRTDDMDVALGSALLLTALGEQPYGELMGHHLAQGFGATRRPDLALTWYQSASDAIDNGATPVFAPGQPERNSLIMNAAYQINGRAAGPAQSAAPQPASLPSFSIAN
ncbi:peptidoglycan-binding protein [Actibacterium sp. XHP0104]|uniref:peptidoglycan-binding protein n=1 Tax=Actibacterium sp. XHP0104 TaxID=2984335 RepID=UPI0021E796EF|nr:peptidoglycan-binding protein [Actibacterium sp. XHP0104]MCV2882540.1 peptidoglycan-binding protein [Actibacterium sp. XHP0104]